jgi:hypothetical protein
VFEDESLLVFRLVFCCDFKVCYFHKFIFFKIASKFLVISSSC